MVEVLQDKWGYEVKTNSEACISAINSYYNQVLCYGRKRDVILEAPKADPHCVLGNILAAHFLCSSDLSKASPFLDAAKSTLENATAFEKKVFDAVSYMISKDRDDDVAVELHSRSCPTMNKSSTYMLCHVYQYQCHFKEAVAFMDECSQSWNSLSSFMYTHNWWHVALCYLEGQSSITKVEEIFDGHIWKELDRSDAAPAEVYLNAAALLLRICVRGETKCFEDRLKSLANCLADHDVWFLEWHLDLLIVWALTYKGYVAEAEDLVKGLESKVSQMRKKKQQLMQRGVSLAKALSEYAKGEYQKALEFLGLEFDAVDYKMIGASDEQLDIFNEIWYDVLINTGYTTKAIQAIEKQLNKREGTPFLWRLLEKCYIKEGIPEAAKIGEKASTLEITYFN